MSNRPPHRVRSRLVQFVGVVAIAGCCAAVFHTRVYYEFSRTRIRVVTTQQPSVDGRIVVVLPDLESLTATPTAVILRLRNESAEDRTVEMFLGGAPLGRSVIGSRQTIRVDRSVSAQPGVALADRIELRGDGDGWMLQYLELANVHGFSTGPFSLVIVPAEATPSSRPAGVVSVLLFLVLIGISVTSVRRDEGRGLRMVSWASVAIVMCLFGTTLALPAVSPYRLLFSAHAFLLCAMWLYGSTATVRMVEWAARLGAAGVARLPQLTMSLFAMSRRLPYGKYFVPLRELGRGLILWPLAGAACLASCLSRRPQWAIGAIMISAILFLLLAMSLRSTPHTYPVGDKALLETYTLHAANGDLRVGAYSRFRWNHPGPVFFYALAPLYALSGGREYSLEWTVLIINLLATFALVTLMVRYGDWPFGVGTMVALSVYFFRPSQGTYTGFGDLLSSPWNPHAPMLPLALLMVLCAGLAAGRVSALPGVVLCASFVSQTHIGMAPTAIAIAVVAVAGFLLSTMQQPVVGIPAEARNTGGPQTISFWIFAAVWLLVLMWALPLTEQIRNGADGNLTQILNTFGNDSSSETPSAAAAFAALAYAYETAVQPSASVAGGGGYLSAESLDPSTGFWVVLQLVLLTAACAWAAWKRRSFPAALFVVCLVTAGVAFWSITQVRGRLGYYLVFWISISSAVNIAALIGTLLSWASNRFDPRGKRVPPLVGQVLIAGFLLLLFAHGAWHVEDSHRRALRGEGPHYRQREWSRSLFLAVENELRSSGEDRSLIRIRQPAWGEGASVVLQLHKGGIPVAVEDRRLFMFTDALAATGEENLEFFLTDANVPPDPSDSPPYRLVAEERGILLYMRSRGVPSTRVPQSDSRFSR